MALPLSLSALRVDPRVYTACYCEENVHNLVTSRAVGAESSCVAFISNAARACPVWWQRSGDPAGARPVVWDYHVVLIVGAPGGQLRVVDLDSTLDSPCPLETYLLKALQPPLHTDEHSEPRLRVIRTADYVAHFASDRRHMRLGDEWLAAPPAYPPLAGEAAATPHNLALLWDVSHLGGGGDVGCWPGTVVAARDIGGIATVVASAMASSGSSIS